MAEVFPCMGFSPVLFHIKLTKHFITKMYTPTYLIIRPFDSSVHGKGYGPAAWVQCDLDDLWMPDKLVEVFL